ncbi:MAG: glycosyltransferase family 87 protein [Phycisphaerae bacterium]|nr:glycosyltransferase family 87 protein [Phycisphaerae bacterium]
MLSPPTAAPSTAHLNAPTAPPLARWACTLLIAITFIRFGFEGALQLGLPHMQPDFEYFYKAGASLLHDGNFDPGYDQLPDGSLRPRGMLDWYWPFVARLMTGFASIGDLRTAGLIWIWINILAAIGAVRMLGREFSGFAPQDWAVTQIIPAIMLFTFWLWEFRLNQVDTLTLWLMVLSFVVWHRGRSGLAGFWLGLAVLLKITPGLLIIWYAAKRSWRTVAAALATILIAGPLADAAIFGPQMAGEAYRAWFTKAVTRGSHGGLIAHGLEMDWRNQSWSAVASRWLSHTNWNTHFDNEPRSEDAREPRYLNLVDLPAPVVAKVVSAITLGSLFLLLVIVRRPARTMTPWELRFEFALVLLAMLWLMPVMRRYHMIWTLPTLTLLGATIHALGPRHTLAKLSITAALFLVVAQLSLLDRATPESLRHLPEAVGVLLATVAALATPIIATRLALARDARLLTRSGAVAEESP